MGEPLKPCPFCGSSDLYVYSGSFYVGCNDCGAEGGWNDNTESAAIAAWNRRAEPVSRSAGNE